MNQTIRTSSSERFVRLGPHETSFETRPDGTIIGRSLEPLAPHPVKLTDALVRWAAIRPEAVLLAERDADGGWRTITYAQALAAVRSIAQALLDRPVSLERPLAILAENSIDHALVAYAAQHIGIPYAPISPPYALVSKDYQKLAHVMSLLTPGLVFAADMRYEAALAATLAPDVEVVVAHDGFERRATTPLDALKAVHPTQRVDEAGTRVTRETIAKILFTSGSTGVPKGVINTQRMLCSNQQGILQMFPFMEETPPIFVDWTPWHHTAGGNQLTGTALYNGGSFYIDEGKPIPGLIEKTVRNLREIGPTIYFNVPKGFEELLPFLRSDRQLRETFFSRMQMLYYAAAAIAPRVWDELKTVAIEACGESIFMTSGFGMTETSPSTLFANWRTDVCGNLGLPLPGVAIKLAPTDDKYEVRVKGPNVTPGYWRQPDVTRAAFDDEGFYRTRDALRPILPHDLSAGFLFDGRLTEDFKLSTGTWVSVGPFRIRLLGTLAPFVKDLVLAGHDRDYVSALLFVDPSVAADPNARKGIADVLARQARESTGSSTRIERAILLDEPPSFEHGEITDKGSINVRAVLARRAAAVDALYAPDPSPAVIIAT
ncbi:MAG TPA: feruloyl-CoA synthase [Candidatus Binatia bacterium]|nr:feruloyl-CoA synthase [Candidatus Binatia bacterium]